MFQTPPLFILTTGRGMRRCQTHPHQRPRTLGIFFCERPWHEDNSGSSVLYVETPGRSMPTFSTAGNWLSKVMMGSVYFESGGVEGGEAAVCYDFRDQVIRGPEPRTTNPEAGLPVPGTTSRQRGGDGRMDVWKIVDLHIPRPQSKAFVGHKRGNYMLFRTKHKNGLQNSE